MTAVLCQIDIPKIAGLKDQELTVGREFFLSCKGDWPRDLVQEKLQLLVPAQAKYQIQLLGFEFRTPEVADIKVTSHQAVPAKFDNLQITDGKTTVDLGRVQYPVQTVIEKSEDPSQKVEAYGAIGPAAIALPLVYIVTGVLIFMAVVGFVTKKLYRYSQRRRLLAKLKDHDSALSPLNQFHHSMRRLQRDNTVYFGGKGEPEHILQAFDELDSIFRLFLTRELHVPAFDWGTKLILANIRKYHHSVYQESAVDLKKLLSEYSLAVKNRETLTDKDILVLSEQTRRLIEKLDRSKQQGART